MRDPRPLPSREIEAIFKRFPEGHPYHIPLKLMFECGMCPEVAFGVTVRNLGVIRWGESIFNVIKPDTFVYYDRKTSKVIENHVTTRSSIISTNLCRKIKKYALLNPNWTSNSVSPQAINYISRIIRGKTSSIDYVDPKWKWEDLCASNANFEKRDWTKYERCLSRKRKTVREKYSL